MSIMEKVYYQNLPETTEYRVPPDTVAPRGHEAMLPVEAPQEKLTDEQLEQALPKPSGHKILISLPKVEDTYEGGLIKKVRSTVEAEQITTVVALVLDMGPDAYKDTERFPSGPWCAVGDYVLIGPYKGTRFVLNGHEYRICNDDSIEGVVAHPAGYRRV